MKKNLCLPSFSPVPNNKAIHDLAPSYPHFLPVNYILPYHHLLLPSENLLLSGRFTPFLPGCLLCLELSPPSCTQCPTPLPFFKSLLQDAVSKLSLARWRTDSNVDLSIDLTTHLTLPSYYFTLPISYSPLSAIPLC